MQETNHRRRFMLAILAAGLLLLAAGTAIMFWNSRDRGLPAGVETAASRVPGPVYKIELPHRDPVLAPPGPHSEKADTLCIQCHSLRLVLNQPRLSEKKWGDVVHKMVVAYGATLSPENERDLVVYLNSIRGLQPDAKPTSVQ